MWQRLWTLVYMWQTSSHIVYTWQIVRHLVYIWQRLPQRWPKVVVPISLKRKVVFIFEVKKCNSNSLSNFAFHLLLNTAPLPSIYLRILAVVAYINDNLWAGRSGIESRWGRDFPPVQTGPGAHPASCTMGIVSFPGVKCGRGVLLTTYPLLVPRSWKSRAIPLPALWATPSL
jgi:hypothetical protein